MEYRTNEAENIILNSEILHRIQTGYDQNNFLFIYLKKIVLIIPVFGLRNGNKLNTLYDVSKKIKGYNLK